MSLHGYGIGNDASVNRNLIRSNITHLLIMSGANKPMPWRKHESNYSWVYLSHDSTSNIEFKRIQTKRLRTHYRYTCAGGLGTSIGINSSPVSLSSYVNYLLKYLFLRGLFLLIIFDSAKQCELRDYTQSKPNIPDKSIG